jgi:hypothetical protein
MRRLIVAAAVAALAPTHGTLEEVQTQPVLQSVRRVASK